MPSDTLVRQVMLQITGDDADAAAKLDAIKAKADELKADNPELSVRIDAASATAQMQVLRQELKDSAATVTVDVDDMAAKAEIDDLKAKIDILKAERAGIEIDADATPAEIKIAELKAELEDLQKPGKIDIDTSGLDKAKSSALALGIAVGAIGAAAPLTALAAGAGLTAAGFAAAAAVTGGFTGELTMLEQAAMSGAQSVGGFSSALGQTGVQAMQDFGAAAGDVGQALGHLFVDLAPEISKADGVVKDIAQDFDKWAQSAGGSDLENFFSKLFGGINMGQLEGDLGDIASLVVNVAKAEHDMSPVAMDALSDVLGVLGHLPPAVIEALTALFVAIKAVGAVSGLIDWAQSFGSQLDKIKAKMSDLFGSGEEEAAAEAGAETGEAYAGGVEEGADVGELGEKTAAELAEGAGAAEAAGTETGAAYAAGLEEGASVGELGAQTAGELAEGATAAGAAGAETGAAYAEGIAGGAEAVAGVGPEAAAQLADGAPAAEAAGAETGAAFAGGVAGGAEATAAVGPEVAATLAEAAAGAEEAGVMTGTGFAEGLAATGAAIEAEAAEIAEVVDATLAAALIIASPSKRLRARGQQAGQGFALGLLDSIGDVEHAAGSLAQVLVSAVGSQQSSVRAAAARTSAAVTAAASAAQGAAGVQTVRLEFAGNANDPLWSLIRKNIRVKGGQLQAVGS